MLKLEKIFPFYISSNMPNADRNNNKLENKFRKNNLIYKFIRIE